MCFVVNAVCLASVALDLLSDECHVVSRRPRKRQVYKVPATLFLAIRFVECRCSWTHPVQRRGMWDGVKLGIRTESKLQHG